jgi:N6-adenosine-specific RNA methylase IME4
LRNVFPKEWRDVKDFLFHFFGSGALRLLISAMSKRIDSFLYERGWAKRSFNVSITVDVDIHPSPTHSIDCSRNRVGHWVPNALLREGLDVMTAWGFTYKTNIVWSKIRKDGGPDGRGVGFYLRNVTELVLFDVRGKNARTLALGQR